MMHMLCDKLHSFIHSLIQQLGDYGGRNNRNSSRRDRQQAAGSKPDGWENGKKSSLNALSMQQAAGS
jgi:hypothetical protein